jgi:hypothetical protein
MEVMPTPSPIWGRRDFFKLVLFHFVLVQVLMPSVLHGRCWGLECDDDNNDGDDDGKE